MTMIAWTLLVAVAVALAVILVLVRELRDRNGTLRMFQQEWARLHNVPTFGAKVWQSRNGGVLVIEPSDRYPDYAGRPQSLAMLAVQTTEFAQPPSRVLIGASEAIPLARALEAWYVQKLSSSPDGDRQGGGAVSSPRSPLKE